MPKFVGKPGYLDTLRIQSLEAAQKGNIARALDLAKRYHARRPDDVRVLNHLAHMHQKLGDWAGVIKYGRRSYDLEPVGKHLGILLDAYARLGRFEPLAEFCKVELKRRTWMDALREPGVQLRLVATQIRARLSVRAQHRREQRLRKQEERRQLVERARRAEAARRAAIEAEPTGSGSIPEAARRVEAADKAHAQLEPPSWPVLTLPALRLDVLADVSDLAADLKGMDRKALSDRVPCVELADIYVKHEGLEDLFQRQFHALNVRVEFKGAREGTAEYLGVGLYYEAKTEDRPDGVLEVWINTDTGAALAWPAHLTSGAAHCSPEGAAAFKPLTPGDVMALAERATRKSREAAAEQLRPHLRSLQEALEREFTVLQDQRRAEWDAAVAAMAKPDASRLAAPQGDLAERTDRFLREVDDLVARRTVQASVHPMDLRRLRLPVMLCSVLITRRESSRAVLVAYNPLTRHFEPLPCHHCDRDSYGLGATDTGELRCARCVKH
ncbi:MAG: hypothetical protein IT449_16300 [Phycisphaerales bacterium]|nr:hypothetical protein [Phycisphaerales bacterium]